jgi:hypothetical protein
MDFSYTLKPGDNQTLALGLKAGASFHKVGLRDIQSSLPDPNEGIFGQDISDVSLNIGTGAFIIPISITLDCLCQYVKSGPFRL